MIRLIYTLSIYIVLAWVAIGIYKIATYDNINDPYYNETIHFITGAILLVALVPFYFYCFNQKIKILRLNMNTIQKICVMVFVGSIALAYIGYRYLGDNYYSNPFAYNTDSFKPNWLLIISIFNIVVSSVAFFLFKDKKEE